MNASYVIVATVVSFLTGWAWYTYLFPRVDRELLGSEEAARGARPKNIVLFLIALLILSGATGWFIQHRNVLDAVDAIKLGIKIWVGWWLPISLVAWGHSRSSLTTLVATAGFWLVAAIEFTAIAFWMGLG